MLRRVFRSISSAKSSGWKFDQTLYKSLHREKPLNKEFFIQPPQSWDLSPSRSDSIDKLRQMEVVSRYMTSAEIRTNYKNYNEVFARYGLNFPDEYGIKQMDDDALLDSHNELVIQIDRKNMADIKTFADNHGYSLDAESSSFSDILRAHRGKKSDDEFLAALKLTKLQKSVHPFDDSFHQAFYSNFQDPIGAFTNFKDTIRDYARKWTDQSFFAPYTALIQSSGTGKSRYISEYGNHGWLMYSCLRPAGVSGFPLRTPILADYLLDKGHVKTFLSEKYGMKIQGLDNFDVAVYLAYYAGVMRTLRLDLMEYVQGHQHLSAKEVVKEHIKYWRRRQFEDQDVKDEFHKTIGGNIYGLLAGSVGQTGGPNTLLKTSFLQMRYQFQTFNQFLRSISLNTKGMYPVLFAFDEGSEFLQVAMGERTKFDSIRYSMNMIPDGSDSNINTFNIVLDTMGRMANFIPPKQRVPSLRFIKSDKLYEPYIDVLNWNLDAPKFEKHALLTMEEKIECYVKSGRPLWRSSPSFDQALKLAKYKLANCVSDDDIKTCEAVQSKLAILSARFGCSISPISNMTSELSRSNLAVCYHASKENNLVISGYPPEPIVGLAAQQLMVRYDNFSLEKLLETYLDSRQTGVVQSGDSGELVANILLANAYDKACEDENELENVVCGVTFEKLLCNLFTPAAYDKIKSGIDTQIWDQLKNGKVNFTQFIRAEYTPGIENISEWFNFGAVCMGKPRQPGWDSCNALIFSEQARSAVLISAKNRKDDNTVYLDAPLTSSLYFSRNIDKNMVQPITKYRAREDFNYPYCVLFMDVFGDKAGMVDVIRTDQAMIEKHSDELKTLVEGKGMANRTFNYIAKINNEYYVVAPAEKQVVIACQGFVDSDSKENIYQISDTLMDLLKSIASPSSQSSGDQAGKAQVMSIVVDPKERFKLYQNYKKE